MNIGVLGLEQVNEHLASYFRNASKKYDVNIYFYRERNFVLNETNKGIKILDEDYKPIKLDGIINWLQYPINNKLYQAFKRHNIPIINNVYAVRNCRNKILTNSILSEYRLPQLETLYISKEEESNLHSHDSFSNKRNNDSKGFGLKKTNKGNDFRRYMNNKDSDSKTYFQKHFDNYTWDIRVMMVGRKVVGTVKKNDVDLNTKVRGICLKTIQVLGLDFATIDIMKGKSGKYYILGVNCTPDIIEFRKTIGINICEYIIKYLVDLTKINL